MQSGQAKSDLWVLEFAQNTARVVDPLMGWTSSGETQNQVRLTFDSQKAAQDYARDNGIVYSVSQPNKRKPIIRQGGYGDNFATKRRTVWTH